MRPQRAERAAAFTRLFRDQYSSVLAYCLRRCAAEQDAVDAAAEVFLVAWRRLDDMPAPAGPWLLGVARRTLANQRRAERRRHALSNELGLLAHTESRRPTESSDDRLDLDAALARLAGRDREALLLWAWEQLPAKEAARVLGITPATYSVRLHRAKRRLRNELRRDDAAGETEPPVTGLPERMRSHA